MMILQIQSKYTYTTENKTVSFSNYVKSVFMLCSYITWLGSDPFRSSFASGECLHGRSGRNERECFGHQHRANRFGRSARPHVNEIPYLNKAEAFVSAAFRPKRAHINALLVEEAQLDFLSNRRPLRFFDF